MSITRHNETPVLNPPTFPSLAMVKRNCVGYRKGAKIFTQDDAFRHVLYIQQSGVRCSAVNEGGEEAVIAILGPRDLFGEDCTSAYLFGYPQRQRLWEQM
jgi:CRP-like cAMP-binding protein